jgi:hypothetical protein
VKPLRVGWAHPFVHRRRSGRDAGHQRGKSRSAVCLEPLQSIGHRNYAATLAIRRCEIDPRNIRAGLVGPRNSGIISVATAAVRNHRAHGRRSQSADRSKPMIAMEPGAPARNRPSKSARVALPLKKLKKSAEAE